MSTPARPHRPLCQWPCRVPEDVDAVMASIQQAEHDDKSGTVRMLLQLGIKEWQRRERDEECFRRNGLSLDQVLPYYGGGRSNGRR